MYMYLYADLLCFYFRDQNRAVDSKESSRTSSLPSIINNDQENEKQSSDQKIDLSSSQSDAALRTRNLKNAVKVKKRYKSIG